MKMICDDFYDDYDDLQPAAPVYKHVDLRVRACKSTHANTSSHHVTNQSAYCLFNLHD